MDINYQMLRTFADSWGLLFMFVVFLVVIVFALNPRAKQAHDDAANIPFKE